MNVIFMDIGPQRMDFIIEVDVVGVYISGNKQKVVAFIIILSEHVSEIVFMIIAGGEVVMEQHLVCVILSLLYIYH